MPALSNSYCRIFPPIGIARLGNSPTEFFLGPEAPNVVPEPQAGYKDEQGRIKRQGARFRLYAFFPDGSVEEVTADHPDVGLIEWTVALANRKAAWHEFDGARNVAKILAGQQSSPLRNAGVSSKDRDHLAIVPDPVVVAGRSTAGTKLEGTFGLNQRQRNPVTLGEARTDEAGRLVVLGGFGHSESVLPTNPLAHYANNDGWFDDTSDGPVTATVTLKDGNTLPVHGRAWVVCAPPHFSPWTKSVVTLYDVMTEAAARHGLSWDVLELGPKPDDNVSFTRDIYPALSAMSSLQWVSRRSQRGHAPGKRGAFPDEAMLKTLASREEARKPNSPHKRFFDRLRHPVATPPYDDESAQPWPVLSPNSLQARRQATLYYMPPLSGDEGDVDHEKPEYWLSITPRQYAKFARWKDGDFVADWIGSPASTPFDQIPVAQQPAALTEAALEWTQGGAFYPGIELTSTVRHSGFYSEAFRVSDGAIAGDLTKWMALPWQSDFYECRDHWWPAVRPDDVVPVGNYERLIEEFEQEAKNGVLADLLTARRPWTRGVGTEIVDRPGFPTLMDGQSAGDYKRAFERLWNRHVDSFVRRYIPQMMVNELDDVYRVRVLEFLDKSILSAPNFVVPARPVGAPEEEYTQTVLLSIRQYIFSNTPVRQPYASESAKAYRDALLVVFSSSEIVNGVLDVVWRAAYAHRGKNEMVRKWHRLGFVAPRTAADQKVWVETERQRFDLLEAREHFYFLMNIETYPEYLPIAKRLGREYFDRARTETEPSLEAQGLDHYKFFKYDPITFEARLEKIYENERREAEKADPVLGTGLEAVFNSPERIIQRIRQLAPFNQLDGSWLERVTKAGPINDVQSFLFEIWSDEIGNGDPSQNHANIYTELLKSAGIYLPPLNSRAYSDHQDLWPGSFSSPAYQSAAALFPETFYPEILGMTLYLEWEAVFLPAMVKLYDYYGYNSLFYRLHVAIDNPVNGHGARARDAVVRYLGDIDSGGEDEVQEAWRRIWDGYLAFKFIGDQDWGYRLANPPTIDERMVEMLVAKRHFGQLNHGTRRFAGNYLNDWFDEPEQFLRVLASSDLIVPGDAAASPIFDTMGQTGVMLKVFTSTEKQLWTDWINSLPPDAPGGMMSPPEEMRALIRQLRARAMSVLGHDGETLRGRYLDPDSGQLVETEATVGWWLAIGQPERLMATLSDPQNGWIVPGDPGRSRFVRELLSERRPMARFLSRGIQEIGGKTARQIIVDWIRGGAQLPTERVHPGQFSARLRLMAAVPERTGARLRDDFAPEVIRRTLSSHRFTVRERTGMRERQLNPGGGAAH
ncbi:LodA/GoxA family CTQ-dependent oxidase [Hansschlegelia zhihuaiae]|nr:LodA/GoxA family CTQ-dependent oxidase [Hansschlegelia zhihuaiae]